MAEKTVLIVDGDAASRNFLKKALHQKGCQALEASLGREGLISAWRDHPDLILIEPALTDLTGEELLQKLRADERAASIPAIAFSKDPNPARKASCLAAGFNEYFRKSSEAIPDLMDAIDLWLASRPTQSPPEPEQPVPVPAAKSGGMLVVFLSAKGGTGVSSLCANIAMNVAAHRPQARVAVVDSVLPIGSIASIVGYEEATNLVTLAEMSSDQVNAAFLREQLPSPPSWNFHLVAGSPDPESAASLKIVRIGQIVQALQEAYDFVFIDVGRSLSQIILPIIQRADLVAIVVSPDMGTVRLSKIVWQFLQSKGLTKDRVFAILNRVVGFEGISKSEVEAALGLNIRSAMPHLGGNFLLAHNQHLPLAAKFPGDTACMILKETAGQIITLAEQIRAGVKQGVKNGSWL